MVIAYNTYKDMEVEGWIYYMDKRVSSKVT